MPGARITRVEVKRVPLRVEAPLTIDDMPEVVEAARTNYMPDEPGFYETMASAVAKQWVEVSPGEARLGFSLTCHVKPYILSGEYQGRRLYFTYEHRPAYSPEDYRRRYGHYPRVYYTWGYNRGVALVIDRLGRAGGPLGWGALGVSVAAALASFRHNFEVWLSGIFKRPCANTSEEWVLPNVVPIAQRLIEARYHARIREPQEFVPPAAYDAKVPPSPVVAYRFGVKAETSVKFKVATWSDRPGGTLMAEVDVELEPGEHEVVVTASYMPFVTNHVVTIEPLHAPRGMTIAYMYTAPPSIC